MADIIMDRQRDYPADVAIIPVRGILACEQALCLGKNSKEQASGIHLLQAIAKEKPSVVIARVLNKNAV